MRRLILLLISTVAFAAPEPLFDGKTFAGWEGDTTGTWRIEEGEIVAGDVSRNQPRNEFLATTRRFTDFELRLKIRLLGTEGFVNAGVQFRTERIPNHHEVSGYQADFGAGYDGALYDESRRKKMLAKPDKETLARAQRPAGEWNDYRIRAEGARVQLWLNGVQTVDFTEADPAIARDGIIALQIHGGAKSQVRYKDIVIEPLAAAAAVPARGPQQRMAATINPAQRGPWVDGKFTLEPGDTVVFTGPENMVLEQRGGWLETLLTKHWRNAAPKFRHMGWEGDTVYRQNRMQDWGSWQENLDAAGATVVFAWFGQLEAMDESKSVADFTKAYAALLDQFARRTPRIVVIGPPLFEKHGYFDNTGRNERVRELNAAACQLAADRGYVFVDVIAGLSGALSMPRTRDGMHLNDLGLAYVAEAIVCSLRSEEKKATPNWEMAFPLMSAAAPLRAYIVEKNRLWFDTWRCMNWAFAYGDRTTQPFATGTDERPRFIEELRQYQPLLEHADATIAALARGENPPPPLAKQAERPDPPAPSVEEEMSRFKLREGFDINLFADEKLGVVRPVQIRWDLRGRLWVACTPSYPQLQPGEHGSDYILILEDTDGDGRADKSTRYAEGLTMPMGFDFAPEEFGGGIYVCESTQLVHLPDRNRDEKADRCQVVLSGFGTGDTHQNINSLRWGPDGFLWFTQGYHIWSYVETPRGVVELNRSGLWRFNPWTLRLDSFLNESGAGLNCWGVAWDDFGQMFHGSGADTAIWHTTPALIPTLHPQQLPTRLAVSRGKSMEPEFLGSSHLPDELRGALMKSTYFTSQVQLYRLRDSGSSFVSEEMGDLISGGNEFRPVESRGGPDGAIYICDWLNPVIGHYQASYRDPRRDRSHGRIWRMTAKDKPLVKWPKEGWPRLGPNMNDYFTKLAESEEAWEREMGRKALLIYTTRLQTGFPRAQHTPTNGPGMKFNAHGRSDFAAQLKDPDFRHRAWAMRQVGKWAVSDDPWEYKIKPLPFLEKGIADPHPRVRMEAVVAASWVQPEFAPEALKIATRALDMPTDPAIHHALTQCVHALEPHWRPALADGRLDFGERVHALAFVLTTVGDRTLTGKVRDLIASGKSSGPVRDSLLATLIEHGTPEDADFAIAQAPESEAVMNALVNVAWRKRDAGYGTVLASLLNGAQRTARIAGCRAIAAMGEAFGTGKRLSQIAADTAAEPAERAAAIVAIGRTRRKDALAELRPFADAPERELRAAAVTALAPFAPEEAAAAVAKWLPTTGSAAEVGALFSPLLGQKDGAQALAAALAKIETPAESARLALAWMAQSGRDDAPLRTALEQAVGITAATVPYSAELVARLVAEAQKDGDARRGEVVFRTAQSTCLACHKVGAEGGTLGPDLSALGRAMTPEMIVESVYWPKRQVKEGFLLTQLALKDGRTFQGYRQSETADTLTLRDPATPGSNHPPVLKKEVATRTDAGTLMPDGLLAWMNDEQRRDLLRYLFELGKN